LCDLEQKTTVVTAEQQLIATIQNQRVQQCCLEMTVNTQQIVKSTRVF